MLEPVHVTVRQNGMAIHNEERRRAFLKFPNSVNQNFTLMRRDGRAIAAKIYSLDPYGKADLRQAHTP